MTKAVTCIFLPERADEAVAFYLETVDDSKIVDEFHFSGPGEGTKTSLWNVALGGTPYQFLGAVGASARPTQAFSISLTVDDQESLDRHWDAFVAAGATEVACGWLTDHFGVSWQIVPRRFYELVGRTDPAVAQRTVESVWFQEGARIQVDALEAAARAGD